MEYGDDASTGASSGTGMSDGMKLGILASTLGLTGLVAWAYSDKGPLSANKTAKGGGAPNGPSFPIGSADWAQWQSQHNPSTYGAHHTASGGGAPNGPSFPIGSADWAQWQSQHAPPTYAPHHHGAPGGGVRHAGHGAYEADHRSQGAGRTYICGGGESPNVIAAKYGRVGAVSDSDWREPGCRLEPVLRDGHAGRHPRRLALDGFLIASWS